ncbi:MAG: hypothetical protein LBU33_03040 [Endomicrobium sp.]|jgi:hypothetical protein|nr:hypothetical protein [Endomicrobium sp.]
MAEKVQKVGVERESGYLYFIDKEGDVSRALMARGKNKKSSKSSKVKKLGLKKESGYFYFLDVQGDISRAVMGRGEKNKTKKTKETASKTVGAGKSAKKSVKK